MSQRPAVLVARAAFPDIVERLRAHFEVEDNPADHIFSKAELSAKLAGKAQQFVGTEGVGGGGEEGRAHGPTYGADAVWALACARLRGAG